MERASKVLGKLNLPQGTVDPEIIVCAAWAGAVGKKVAAHTRAARLRIWDNLDKAFQEQLIISGRVLGRVKGGLAVDVGIKAFMPGSQADPRPVHNLDSLVGQDIPVKIIKLNRRRGNVVVSRKLAIEQEAVERKNVTPEVAVPRAS